MCGLHMAKQQFASGVVDWSIPMLCAQQEVVGGKHWTTCGGGPVEIGEEPLTVSLCCGISSALFGFIREAPVLLGKIAVPETQVKIVVILSNFL